MRPAAFFDMDHTLLRINSGERWIDFLQRRNEITRMKKWRALGWLVEYKFSILDMETVVGKVTASMAGESEAEFVDKCTIFVREEVIPQIADRARAVLAEHQKKGHLVAILSSTTPYVGEPLAQYLGIEHVLCTRLEVKEGRFTGSHLAPACYGRGKVHYAEVFCQKHQIDLKQSFFYSDSFSDRPMFERVGAPHVVNPDRRLRRHAVKVGWPVEMWQ